MYHINNDGDAGFCKAEKGKCPFNATEHFATADEARAAFEESMIQKELLKKPLVKKTAKGSLVWRSPEAKLEAVKDELKAQGYTLRIPESELKRKYFVARSATQVSGLIEHSFASDASLKKFLAENGKYGSYHNSYEVVNRSMLEKAAAEKILNN